LMTLGHLVFALHFFMMGWKFGPRRLGAALLASPGAVAAAAAAGAPSGAQPALARTGGSAA